MPDNPLVSVVMPCYNAEEYLEEAIESILGQTYRSLELIVVDDQSSDNSLEIIEKYRGKLTFIKNHDNLGPSGSLNRGILAARGEFVARMDADDISGPDRLLKQVAAMTQNENVAVVGTNVKVIDQEGNILYQHNNPCEDREIRKALAYCLPLWPGSQMWRKEKLLEAGLFDEEIPGCEDLELTLRLCKVGEARNISEPLYFYRKNTSGDFNISIFSQMERLMLARKAFYLKNQGDSNALKKHYQIFAEHFRRTKFSKGNVSLKNRAIYFRNIALINLINQNKDLAKQYLDKAREIEPRSLSNNIINLLIKLPQIIVDSLYLLNKIIKKQLYQYYCGNVEKYLKRPAMINKVKVIGKIEVGNH